MLMVNPIQKECGFCSKEAENYYLLSYGLFGSNYQFGFVCNEHARKIGNRKFKISLDGAITFFEVE